MADVTAADIVARLRSGADPARIAADLMPDDVRAALHYAAPLRWVDDSLWRDVVLPRAGVALPLQEISDQDLGREVPLDPGHVVLRDEVRAAHLATWNPDRLADYSRELVPECAGRGLVLEALYHRLLADAPGAVADFEERFDAALARFDLRAAQDLLDVFDRPDRRELVDTGLRERLTLRRAQLVTRAAWSDDYYRSVGFLDRPAYTQVLAALVDGTLAGRAVQLVARGGMGKTMLLRWWIARRCIPAGVLVSRVDFDDVDPGVATRNPWLVVLALAHQLNEQLPTRPFEELLDERRRLLPALYRGAGRETSAALQELETIDGEALGEEVLSRYAAGIAAQPDGPPVVVVLDTLEVPLLRTDLDLSPLVRDLAAVFRSTPRSRLALAGRYEIASRPELRESLERLSPVVLQLSPFTVAEARAYLTRQGIDRADLVDAVVAKGDLLPFVLALYADLARQNPDLTAEEIRAYEDPKLLYLIERVLERIDDLAVRYVLRYGVVARQFDKRFLAEVMRPFIEAALADQPRADVPGRTRHPRVAAVFEVDRPVAGALDVEALWRRLGGYVAQQSWVSVVEGLGEYLSFHPDVRQPMRLVLEEQAAFGLLNRAAADYFRRLADEEPGRWTRWAQESAYHLFQAEGPAAEPAWSGLLAQARRGGAARRAELAAAVTADPDLVRDGGLQPQPWFGGQPVMLPETLAAAHLEVALAATTLPDVVTARERAEQRLGAIQVMETRAGRPLVDSVRRDAVRRCLRVRAGAAAVEDLLARLEQTNDDVLLEILVGVALTAEADLDDAGLRRIEAVLTARRDLVAIPALLDGLRVRRVELLLRDGDLAAAGAGLASVRDPLVLKARVLVLGGRYHEAAEGLLAAGLPATVETLELAGDALLAAGEPLRVRSLVNPLDPVATAGPGATVRSEASRRAAEAELAGRAAIELGDLRGGLSLIQTAGRYWGQAGNKPREAATFALAAAALLDHGRIREAEDHLRSAEQLPVPPDHPTATRIRLLRARWLDRTGTGEQAATTALELQASFGAAHTSWTDLARLGVQGLSLQVTGDAVERFVGVLAAAVRRVRPPEAALAGLEGIERARTLPPALARSPQFQPLAALLDQAPALSGARRVDEVPVDEVNRLLRLAELARVADRRDRAAELVDAAGGLVLAGAGGPGSLLPLRVLRCAARLGRQGRPGRADALLDAVRAEHSRRPALLLDALTSWSELVGPRRSAGRAEEMLGLLQTLGEPTARNAAVLALRLRAVTEGVLPGSAAEVLDIQRKLLTDLGDERALRDLAPAGTTREVVLPEDEVVELVLDEQPPGIRVTWSRCVGGAAAPGGGDTVHPSWMLDDRWQAGGSTRLVGRFAKDPAGAIGDLAAILRPATAVGAGDVCLRARTPRLAELPWEAAWRVDGVRRVLFRGDRDQQRRRIRRVQQAVSDRGWPCVADGIIGPQTRAALSGFQRTAGLPVTGLLDRATEHALAAAPDGSPLRVLVLRRSHEVQLHKVRAVTPVTVDGLYQRVGDALRVRVVEDPTQRMLASLPREPVDVVHLQASLESLGGDAGLSFGSGTLTRSAAEYGVETLTVTDLHDLLAAARTGLGPLVVLEATAPAQDWEAARQLLLRNNFAHRLYAMGAARAVVALGPVALGGEAAQARELVVRAVTGQQPDLPDLRELWTALCLGELGRAGGLASTPTAAVFCEDPAGVGLHRPFTPPPRRPQPGPR